MTEMMDLSSDVGGPGLPLLDYKTYAERVFFPGQQVAPLSRQLDLPDSRRPTVEQGLQQLNNLLNNRLFLTRVGRGGGGGGRGHVTTHLDLQVTAVFLCACPSQFIHTLEAQQGFSQRDRGYVASLLTMALHDKLEYFTEVMKSLLQDLVQQYVAKNPKLMLRRYVMHTTPTTHTHSPATGCRRCNQFSSASITPDVACTITATSASYS